MKYRFEKEFSQKKLEYRQKYITSEGFLSGFTNMI